MSNKLEFEGLEFLMFGFWFIESVFRFQAMGLLVLGFKIVDVWSKSQLFRVYGPFGMVCMWKWSPDLTPDKLLLLTPSCASRMRTFLFFHVLGTILQM